MTTEAQIPPFREQLADKSWKINFNRPQSELMVSKAQYPIMQCGTQVGKTSALVEWLAQEMSQKGPGDYMFVSPTYPLMERKAIGELRERFSSISGEFVHQPGYKRFVSREQINGNPAYVIMLGSAVNPDSLESSTLKGIAVDEIAQTSFPRGAWDALQRRANVNKARIAAGTTLYDVSSWYKYEIYDKWVAGDPRFEIIQADSVENPAFPKEQYYQAMDDLPWWLFNMQYRGIFEKPTGLIYDAFDEETQVISAIPIPKEWPRFWGHDFGPSNTAGINLAQDPSTGLFYVTQEYLRGDRMSPMQHASEWKRLSEGTTVLRRIGGSWTEEEIRYAYLSAGWPIDRPAIRDVEAGITQVYSFVAKGQIFVFRECHRFINEIMSYTREIDQETYEATDKIQNKARFHLMDSLRYLMSWFGPERVNNRKEAIMKKHQERNSRRGRRLARVR